MPSIQDLNQQFALSDSLKFAEHSSGLLIGLVQTDLCSAQFFLQGAHVSHFHPSHAAKPILFMSEAAIFEPNRPIRGGIPICFPWFSNHPGDPSLPAHGWARTSTWQVHSTKQTSEYTEVILVIKNENWHLSYRLRFGAKLEAIISVHNNATQQRAFEIALHTYFDIGNIDQVEVTGDLAHLPYLDQLTAQTHPPSPDPIQFTAETDRIYQGSAPRIQLHDQANLRTIVIESKNSDSTVVWNPWIAKSIRMADFGNDEYLRMCCIETANVRQNQITLQPNGDHTTSLTISVTASA